MSSRAMHVSMVLTVTVEQDGYLVLEGEEKLQINALITVALR